MGFIDPRGTGKFFELTHSKRYEFGRKLIDDFPLNLGVLNVFVQPLQHEHDDRDEERADDGDEQDRQRIGIRFLDAGDGAIGRAHTGS